MRGRVRRRIHVSGQGRVGGNPMVIRPITRGIVPVGAVGTETVLFARGLVGEIRTRFLHLATPLRGPGGIRFPIELRFGVAPETTRPA